MVEVDTWRYTAKARRDIKSILDYTDEQWGTAQMVVYAREIHAAILMLCRLPEAGHVHPRLKPGMRLFTVGSHLLVYSRRGRTLIISRVLHQNMSLRKYL